MRKLFSYYVYTLFIGEELLTNLVSRQNDLFSHSEVVAKSLENIYYKNNHMTDWPDCECELIYDLQAGNYCDSIKAINKVTRSTANLVLTDKAIEPIRAATTVMKEELDSLIKERQLKVTDYDSYRRRLTEKEAKYAALVVRKHNIIYLTLIVVIYIIS